MIHLVLHFVFVYANPLQEMHVKLCTIRLATSNKCLQNVEHRSLQIIVSNLIDFIVLTSVVSLLLQYLWL